VLRAPNVPISPILVTLIMAALCSSETSLLTRTKRRNIPEEGIFLATAVKTSNLTLTNAILIAPVSH
jgi:hypothetical protein